MCSESILGNKSMMTALVCPRCSSALGKFIVGKGLPCSACGIFFKTAWGKSEDGRYRQYLTPVDDNKRDAKGGA